MLIITDRRYGMCKPEASFVNGEYKFTLSDYSLDEIDIFVPGISKQEIMDEAAHILDEHDMSPFDLTDEIADEAYDNVLHRNKLVADQVELLNVVDVFASRLEQSIPDAVLNSHIESTVRSLDELAEGDYRSAMYKLMEEDMDEFDKFVRAYTTKTLERVFATEALAKHLGIEDISEEEADKMFDDDLTTYVFPCFAYSTDAIADAKRLIAVRQMLESAKINYQVETPQESTKRFLSLKGRESTGSLTYEDIIDSIEYLRI